MRKHTVMFDSVAQYWHLWSFSHDRYFRAIPPSSIQAGFSWYNTIALCWCGVKAKKSSSNVQQFQTKPFRSSIIRIGTMVYLKELQWSEKMFLLTRWSLVFFDETRCMVLQYLTVTGDKFHLWDYKYSSSKHTCVG